MVAEAGEVALERAVAELQNHAANNPMNPLQRPQGKYWRFVDVAGYPCHIQFTMTPLGLRKSWHLSCACKRDDSDNPKALPEFVVEKIVRAFYGERKCIKVPMPDPTQGDVVFEIESRMFPGIVRQFIRLENNA